jgi:hypothetical protein
MGWVEKDEQGNVTVHAPAAGSIPELDARHLPKAYLDTCLVSGARKLDLGPECRRP